MRDTEPIVLTDKNFTDWHGVVFGFGYGSGEEHWLPALHTFFTKLTAVDRNRLHCYDAAGVCQNPRSSALLD